MAGSGSSLLEALSPDQRDAVREAEVPEQLEPMLATLTDEAFSHPAWIYERKLDGERCLAWVTGGEALLRSRSGRDNTSSYPEVAEALTERARADLVVDGEIVAFEGRITSFQRLQPRMQISDPGQARRSGVAVYYYVFDLVHLDDFDLSDLELRSRKKLLKRAIDFGDPLRFTPHRNQEGEDYFEEACRKGWEGLIAKDAHSGYVTGRSRKWLKFKCVHRQELVIGGYTDPKGARQGLGALLVGYYRKGDLVYAGKVGTGFDQETLERLGHELGSLERSTSPFTRTPDGDGVHFVTPRLVGEFGFTEWTRGGKLRHPRFLGLRRDKDPKEVVRERPT
ncbi:MAG: non-homologous end-joining DNA ligase [Acidimicrobiia bacterium]